MKLTTKLLLVITVGAAITMAMIGVRAFTFTTAVLQQSIAERQTGATRNILETIDRLLHERLMDIVTVAGDQRFEDLLSQYASEPAAALRRLNELSILTGPWDALTILDRTGTAVVATDRAVIGLSVDLDDRLRQVFVAAMQGEPQSSDLILDGPAGKPTMLFCAPIRDRRAPRGPIVGAVLGYLAWPAVSQILENVTPHVVLVNRQGIVIGENNAFEAAARFGQPVGASPLIQPALQGKATTVVLPSGQGFLEEEALAVAVPQRGYLSYRGNGWALLLEEPLSLALMPARRSAFRLTIWLMPMVAGLAMVAWWIIQTTLTRPIIALMQVTQVVAAGDLTQRASVRSSDELGQLAASFNTMTERLQALYAGLERQVEARTAELRMEIAQRRSAEEELAGYARALERSNKELDDFTYIVSHDLKEPLRSLDAFSKFVMEDYKEQLGEEGVGYLQRVRANAKRMQDLIEDLLEVSRLSRRENEFAMVDLAQVLTDVKLRFEHILQERQVRLTIGPLPTILCDRVRITEVFANLISNAIKYNPSADCRVEVGCREGAQERQFHVRDNGPGIPPQYHEKIFEIFQRLGKKEEQEGTGIGLTIVKKVVELHKGRIWVESAEGQGTTLHFTIPTNEQVLRGQKLGEILIAQGKVSAAEVDAALTVQQRGGRPPKEPRADTNSSEHT